MKILIADDEPLARERLERLLKEIGGNQLLAQAKNGREAVDLSYANHPDLCILDVKMPEMDGLQAARKIKSQVPAPLIVFATAYEEHALQAFSVDALDYLVKPIRKEYLAAAINKARLMLAGREQIEPMRRHICALVGQSTILVPIDDIIYFHADHKYVTVVHEKGEFLLEESLKQLEQEFSPRFIRIHRNALVSKHKIKSLSRRADGGYIVRLQHSEAALEVSRRNVTAVREALKKL
ncbi:MAG: LytR/AlgR family response regulator transcription factor [bacterium]